jgi:hypothetical protein
MTERARPSAAQALYGHLKSGMRDVVERRDQPTSIADALYPRPQPAPTNWHRELLLKHLRELNMRNEGRR